MAIFGGKIPTDLEILEATYDRYASSFRLSSKNSSNHIGKVFVSVDIEALAKQLNINPHELFGRFYYHLANKYRYAQGADENGDAQYHRLFEKVVGGEMHCVNFPLMTAVLADLRIEDSRKIWALRFSLFSLLVSGASLISAMTR